LEAVHALILGSQQRIDKTREDSQGLWAYN
jgi:hypothetical protein